MTRNTPKGNRIGTALTVAVCAVSAVVMLGGLVLMAGALAPSTRPDIMTENARGMLMLSGMCALFAGAMGFARALEVR
jgi:hypothetical protein